MIDTIFLLAGGFGTRLGELTKEIPKPMIDINGKPLLERELDWYSSFGIKKAIFGVGHKNHIIEDHFGNKYKNIEIIYSKEEEPMGTGGALKLAEDYLPDEFIFANGDLLMDFDLNEMIKQHEETNALITTGLKEVEKDLERFGTVVFEDLKIKKFVEKTNNPPSNLIHAGISIIKKELLDLIPEGVKFSMERELYTKLAEQGKQYGFLINGFWIDVGVLKDLEKARELF